MTVNPALAEVDCGALDDCLEHLLEIGRRGGDDAQHLGGGGLLLQRLAQFGVPPLQLGEQPGVLDGDDRLVGEALQQGDVSVSERIWLGSVEGQHTDRSIALEHWRRDIRAPSPQMRRCEGVGKLLPDGQNIRHVERTTIKECAAGHGHPAFRTEPWRPWRR